MTDVATELDVHVPVDPAEFGIRAGSAILSLPAGPDAERVAIDYEGFVYQPETPPDFEAALQIAAWRCVDRAPTVARRLVPAARLCPVATARHDPALRAWVLERILDAEALARWIGAPPPPCGGSAAVRDRAAALAWRALPPAARLKTHAQAGGDGGRLRESLIEAARRIGPGTPARP